jgi:hypothetical protein
VANFWVKKITVSQTGSGETERVWARVLSFAAVFWQMFLAYIFYGQTE